MANDLLNMFIFLDIATNMESGGCTTECTKRLGLCHGPSGRDKDMTPDLGGQGLSTKNEEWYEARVCLLGLP